MDPLSIIGTAAGVATAGISLVTVFLATLDKYRNTPKEISTIARGVQILLPQERRPSFQAAGIATATACLGPGDGALRGG